MHVHVYVNGYPCACKVHTYVGTHIHQSLCACMHRYIRPDTHAGMYTKLRDLHVYLHGCKNEWIYVYIYIHRFTHTHTPTYLTYMHYQPYIYIYINMACITLQYIAIHCVALLCLTSFPPCYEYFALHYAALQCASWHNATEKNKASHFIHVSRAVKFVIVHSFSLSFIHQMLYSFAHAMHLSIYLPIYLYVNILRLCMMSDCMVA